MSWETLTPAQHSLAWNAGFQAARHGKTRDHAPEKAPDHLLTAWFAGFSRCKAIQLEANVTEFPHFDLADDPQMMVRS